MRGPLRPNRPRSRPSAPCAGLPLRAVVRGALPAAGARRVAGARPDEATAERTAVPTLPINDPRLSAICYLPDRCSLEAATSFGTETSRSTWSRATWGARMGAVPPHTRMDTGTRGRSGRGRDDLESHPSRASGLALLARPGGRLSASRGSAHCSSRSPTLKVGPSTASSSGTRPSATPGTHAMTT